MAARAAGGAFVPPVPRVVEDEEWGGRGSLRTMPGRPGSHIGR
jgi:hypothetical protein